MSLLSPPIFKVNKLIGKNMVKQIFVFFGNNLDVGEVVENEVKDLNALFATDRNNKIFSGIFEPDELTNIDTNNIEVIFLKQSIHIDDTIGTIKLKVFEALGKTVSIDELYLFCLKTDSINPITLYQNLTQNDKIPLTKLRLENMLTNIYNNITGVPIDFQIENKNKYTFGI